MNKKIKIFAVIGATLGMSAVLMSNAQSVSAVPNEGCYVDFYNNYAREEFTLSNGFQGRGNSLLYKTITVEKGSLVTKPALEFITLSSWIVWFCN